MNDAPHSTPQPGPVAAAPAAAAVYPVLLLMLVLSGLDQTVLSTALPAIVADLHGQAGLVSWVFSAYLMASTAVIPVYGKLADRLGVRPLLLLATGLFALGSAACAAAGSLPALVAARALQGLGGGGLMTLTMVAVASLYPPQERPRRMGLLGAAYGIATLVGPLVGGTLLTWAAWPWAFLINLPGALLALAVLARHGFGQARPSPKPFDRAGAVLLAAGLVALLLATRGLGHAGGESAGQAGVLWDGGPALSPLAALVLAGGLLGAWVLVQRRAQDPLVPLALLAQRGFVAAVSLSALSGVALFAAVVFVPLYLQQGLGLSLLGSALHTLPLMLGITLAGQWSGRALRAGQPLRRLAALAATGLTLGFALLAGLLLAAPSADRALAAALLPLGLGLGLLFPLVTVVAQRSVPSQHLGLATAVPVMLRALGGALGVALLGELLQRHLAQALAAAASSAAAAATAATAATLQAVAADALAGGVARLCAWAAASGVLALLVSRALPQGLATLPPAAGVTGAPAPAAGRATATHHLGA